MTKAQLAKIRKRLLALRDELVREGTMAIAPNRKDASEVGGDEDEQPLNEMAQSIASNRNKARATELARIDKALRRLDAAPDDFGLCADCEEEIPEKRLLLVPQVERCVACAQKRDGPKGPASRKHLTDYKD